MNSSADSLDQRARQEARERLIIGLDLSRPDEAEKLVAELGDAVVWYKVGYQLGYGGGFSLIADLAGAGKKVFVDFKLHDIPNTVARGVESLAASGAAMTTVHAYPQTMRAAAEGATGSDLSVIAVTVLTSMTPEDLTEAGYTRPLEELVAERADGARQTGLAGCVGAVSEAGLLRRALGPDALVVTPGIRPAGSRAGDQRRIATPAEALDKGASHLVVARPILQAPEPKAAALAILDEIAGTMAAGVEPGHGVD